jgi:hypothetical protein
LGTHQACVEGDVVKLKWIGDLEAADIRELIPLMDATIAEHSRVFVIVDSRRAGRAGPDIRAAAAHWPNYGRVAGLAYIGASLTVRVLTSLTLGARKLLGGKLPGPTRFVDTEEQAYACIEGMRRGITSQGPLERT